MTNNSKMSYCGSPDKNSAANSTRDKNSVAG